jgi:exodeoxyribonuclease V alpha subunit
VSSPLFVSDDDSATLDGNVEHVVYTSPDTGWTVARLSTAAGLVTVVGNLAGVQIGECLRLTGRWEEDRRYGKQFRATSFLCVQPSTLVGIEKYLGSGLVKGIGPVTARRLVERFGLDTLRIIDEDASRLHEVPGLGRTRIAAIQVAWRAQRSIRDVMVFLQSHGVSAAFAARIYKQYESRAIAVVRDNPYQLARDVAGIGFLSADRIAREIGIAPDAPQRIDAGVLHCLEEAAEAGHCYVPRARLVEAAASLLECEADAVGAALERLALRGDVVVEADVDDVPVYDAGLHAIECAAAAGLLCIVGARRHGRQSRVDVDLEAFERSSNLQLAPLQRRAVARAIDAPALVVTGGPGTGKTTLVRGVLHALHRRREHAVLCAPTGRAAKRLSEATGHPAQTIHRLLEWNPAAGDFQRGRELPLEADLVIVDEVSMVDVRLFRHLVEAVRPGARLLLVGDADQLPSVGPGAVLADCIASGAVECIRLHDIYRQDEASRIVTNAHRILEGEAPLLPPPGERADFVLVERSEPAELLGTLRKLVAERLPASLGIDPKLDVQVLVPMHRGTLGAAALNAALQEVLNPGGIAVATAPLQVGDKVMQIRNNYDLEVFNGDLGIVEEWNEADRVLHVRIDDRRVRYESGDLPELVLAYACTVHKSQGSEYPVVVLVLHRQHHVMLQRNLLYTAVTRARKQVIVLGEARALHTAIRNDRVQLRWTRLAARLNPPAGG